MVRTLNSYREAKPLGKRPKIPIEKLGISQRGLAPQREAGSLKGRLGLSQKEWASDKDDGDSHKETRHLTEGCGLSQKGFASWQVGHFKD